MELAASVLLAVVIVIGAADAQPWQFGGGGAAVDGALRMNYYSMSCPLVEMTVRSTVLQALRRDPTLAAGLLRLHFHDCFVQGCDASVLIDSTEDNKAEKDSPANGSLRGYEVIDEAKRLLEMRCPGVVSCADIVALAARDAVFFAGGPFYAVWNGRLDGRRSRIEDTVALPRPDQNATSLIDTFGKLGFTVPQLVALSGGHTLGVAHCSSFKDRIAAGAVDPEMDAGFAASLAATCSAGDAASAPFDATPNAFDTAYFGAVRRGQGVLGSDQALYASPATAGLVSSFAESQAAFGFYFTQGMARMGQLNVKSGAGAGEVRLNCRKIN